VENLVLQSTKEPGIVIDSECEVIGSTIQSMIVVQDYVHCVHASVKGRVRIEFQLIQIGIVSDEGSQIVWLYDQLV
jgi:hypothetical protein